MYRRRASIPCDNVCKRHLYSYTPGKSIVFYDHRNLVEFVTAAIRAEAAGAPAAARPRKFANGSILDRRLEYLASQYRSVIFEAHLDYGVCRKRRLHEIVYLGRAHRHAVLNKSKIISHVPGRGELAVL